MSIGEISKYIAAVFCLSVCTLAGLALGLKVAAYIIGADVAVCQT